MSKNERIVIHHIEGRRSERVAWLLEELGVPYELDFIQGDIFGSLLALEKHHEMRMAPIVHIGDVVMVESAAILEYLLSKYGKGSTLRPTEDSAEFPAYLEFLHFAEGTALAKIIADVADTRMRKALADAGRRSASTREVAGTRRFTHGVAARHALRREHAGEAPVFRRLPVHRGRHHDAVRAEARRPDCSRRGVQRQSDSERRNGLLRRLSESEGLHAAHGGAAGIPTRDEVDDAERPTIDVSA